MSAMKSSSNSGSSHARVAGRTGPEIAQERAHRLPASVEREHVRGFAGQPDAYRPVARDCPGLIARSRSSAQKAGIPSRAGILHSGIPREVSALPITASAEERFTHIMFGQSKELGDIRDNRIQRAGP